MSWRGQFKEHEKGESNFTNPSKFFKEFDQKSQMNRQEKNTSSSTELEEQMIVSPTGSAFHKKTDFEFGQGHENQKWTKSNSSVTTGQESFASQSWNPKSKRK